MKILLLGYSNLAKKRVINHFLKKKYTVEVASISHKKKIKNISMQYSSYNTALKKTLADLIYISLPNSMHYKWAHKALSLGYHVVVDKPLCNNKVELNRLINLSFKNKKLLVEATFFNYHEQFTKTLNIIGNLNNISQIHCDFNIPMPHKSSLLRSIYFNGGALMDMGPYAASIARIFCNEKIIYKKFYSSKNKKNLVYSFKFLINYESKILTGNFKFGGAYKNNLTILTNKKLITLNRIFSPPADENLYLTTKTKKKITKFKIKKDDCFANFFNEVVKNIKNNNNDFYIPRIIFDNNFRNIVLKK